MAANQYDVMISYRRTDSLFVDRLVERLDQLDVRYFRDVNAHRDGHEFRPEWIDALKSIPDPDYELRGPSVLVLLTPAMCEHRSPGQDVVIQELQAANTERARGRELAIVPLIFNQAAYEEIGSRLGVQSHIVWRDLHVSKTFTSIDVTHPSQITESQIDENCEYIIWLSRDVVTRKLQQLKDATVKWANSVTSVLYSKFEINEALQPSGNQAIIGTGGSGKSVQMARTILKCAGNTRIYPILLLEDDLVSGGKSLLERLSLRSGTLAEGLDALQRMARNLSSRIVFVTDGLERLDVDVILPTLLRLKSAGDLWITSRPEAFERANRNLAIGQEEISFSKGVTVQRASKQLGLPESKIEETRRFLCQALYFDIAERLKNEEIDLGHFRNPTQLLEEFIKFSVKVPVPTVNREVIEDENNKFLERLADLQYSQGTFEVHRDALSRACAPLNYTQMTQRLSDLVVDDSHTKLVRLRHDIIDSYNLAKYKLENFEALDEGGKITFFTHPTSAVSFEGFIQYAHDKERSDFIRKVLAFFLAIVDRKQDKGRDPKWDISGWNLGYAATAKGHILVPELMRLMSGTFVGKSGTSTSDPPALVEASLSSVASLMRGLDTESVDDNGEYLRILCRMIGRADLRARLIEAVSKLKVQNDAAFKFLVSLAEDASVLEKDIDVALYLAPALRDFVNRNSVDQAWRLSTAQVAIEKMIAFVDARLASDQEGKRKRGFDLKLRRRLVESLRSIAGQDISQLRLGAEELDAGLSLHDSRMQYSDWDEFERYTSLLRLELRNLDELQIRRACVFVGRGLHNFHIRCAQVAIDTLGHIDHPWARGILVAAIEWLEDEQSLDRVLEALKGQLEYGAIGVVSSARRAAAAREESGRGARIEPIIAWLSSTEESKFISSNSIEISMIPGMESAKVAQSADDVQMPTWMTEQELNLDVGEELERKVRVGSLGGMLTFANGTWKDPVRMHRAVQARTKFGYRRGENPRQPAMQDRVEEGERFVKSVDDQLEALGHLQSAFEDAVQGKLSFPNIAVVHVVLVSSDGQILEAQRGMNTAYAPGAWSCSFEEQMIQRDFEKGVPVLETVIRGLREEFGFVGQESLLEIRSIKLSLEWSLANPAIMTVVGTTLSSTEFDLECDSSKRDGEVPDQRWVSADHVLATIQHSVAGFWYHNRPGSNHPSNTIRLAMAQSVRSDSLS